MTNNAHIVVALIIPLINAEIRLVVLHGLIGLSPLLMMELMILLLFNLQMVVGSLLPYLKMIITNWCNKPHRFLLCQSNISVATATLAHLDTHGYTCSSYSWLVFDSEASCHITRESSKFIQLTKASNTPSNLLIMLFKISIQRG